MFYKEEDDVGVYSISCQKIKWKIKERKIPKLFDWSNKQSCQGELPIDCLSVGLDREADYENIQANQEDRLAMWGGQIEVESRLSA